MSSADLVAALVADPERPWAEWARGRPLTQRQLARLLKPFCIISQTVHTPGFKDAKGYRRIDFQEAWSAYLPGQNPSSHQFCPSDPSKRRNPDAMGTSCDSRSVQATSPDESKNAHLSNSHAGLDARTNRKPQSGAQSEFDQGSAIRLCDHCGASATPADPLHPWDWPARPDGIWLHSRCEAPWSDNGGQPVTTADKGASQPS
jgi:hypothetical protein